MAEVLAFDTAFCFNRSLRIIITVTLKIVAFVFDPKNGFWTSFKSTSRLGGRRGHHIGTLILNIEKINSG